jgi:hypothetical protein
MVRINEAVKRSVRRTECRLNVEGKGRWMDIFYKSQGRGIWGCETAWKGKMAWGR